MEVTKKPVIKSIPYEEFQDNETLEKIIQELNAGGVNVVVGALDTLIDWGRSNSLWPLTFATSCCGIEFMAVCAARYDIARFGFEVTRNSPRQADAPSAEAPSASPTTWCRVWTRYCPSTSMYPAVLRAPKPSSMA